MVGGVHGKEPPEPEVVRVRTVWRLPEGPFLRRRVTGVLSPPAQVIVTGLPAVSDVGVEVKAICAEATAAKREATRS